MRAALNRLTFGARGDDVAYARSIGIGASLADQFNVSAGDAANLAVHVANQTMPIKYASTAPGKPWTKTVPWLT